MFDDSKFCLGALCVHGHEYEDSGKSLRHICGNPCATCMQKRRDLTKDQMKLKRLEHVDEKAKYDRKYRIDNHDIIKIKKQEYYKNSGERLARHRKKYKHSEKGMKVARISANKRYVRKIANGGSYTNEQFDMMSARFGNVCGYCSNDGKLHTDHIISVSNGGSSDINNIIIACPSCNLSKGVKHMETWYRTKEFFTEERLDKIYKHMETIWT